MEIQVLDRKFPQDEETSNTYTKSRETSGDKRKSRRAQAFRSLPKLGFCVLCGDRATHRHSKSNHADKATVNDIMEVCANCHHVIHYDDREAGGASWAWRNRA